MMRLPPFVPRSISPPMYLSMAHRMAVENAQKDFKETENRLVGRFEVLAVDKNGKILGRGKSPIQDLFVNNFGNWLGSLLLLTPSGTNLSVSLTDTGNVARTLYMWGVTAASMFNYPGTGTTGLFLGVGSGVSAPARTDYKLQTQLGSWTGAANGTNLYNASTYQIVTTSSILISAGGTVNEAAAAFVFNDSGGVLRTIMVAHDAISPAVVIPAGASAVPTWTVQI